MTNGSLIRRLKYAMRLTNPVWFWTLGVAVVGANAYICYRTGIWTRCEILERTIVSWIAQ